MGRDKDRNKEKPWGGKKGISSHTPTLVLKKEERDTFKVEGVRMKDLTGDKGKKSQRKKREKVNFGEG